MFGVAGRRIAEGIIALFALLGFAFVPLGKKTALEHARDILSTPAAVNAFHEIGAAVGRLREKFVGSLLVPPTGKPPERPSDPKPVLPALEPKPGVQR